RTPSWTTTQRARSGTRWSARHTDSWRSAPPATTSRILGTRCRARSRRVAVTWASGTATTIPTRPRVRARARRVGARSPHTPARPRGGRGGAGGGHEERRPAETEVLLGRAGAHARAEPSRRDDG